MDDVVYSNNYIGYIYIYIYILLSKNIMAFEIFKHEY